MKVSSNGTKRFQEDRLERSSKEESDVLRIGIPRKRRSFGVVFMENEEEILARRARGSRRKGISNLENWWSNSRKGDG